MVLFIYNSRDYGFIRSAHGGIKKGIGSLHPVIKEELRVIMLFSSLWSSVFETECNCYLSGFLTNTLLD